MVTVYYQIIRQLVKRHYYGHRSLMRHLALKMKLLHLGCVASKTVFGSIASSRGSQTLPASLSNVSANSSK